MTASQPQPPQEVTRAQFLSIYTVVALPMFLGAVDQTLLATATPAIAAHFGDLYNTPWIMSVYMLTSAVTVPIYGRLGDRDGRREVLRAAVCLFVLGAIACSLAPSMQWLIFGRAIQGLGGGGLISLSLALIGDLVPVRQRAGFQGYFSATFTASNVLGPMLGGMIVANFSWRLLFIAYMPIAAFAVWRISKLPRGSHNPNAPGVRDVAGIVMFSMGITALLFGLSSAGHRFDWLSWQMAALTGIGLVAWTIMYWHARRHPAPFFPFELLRDPALRRPVLSVMCMAFCLFALVFYLPIYLQLALRSGAGQAGMLLMPVMLGNVVSALVTGRVVERTGRPQPPAVVGFTLVAFAFFGLALLAPGATLIAALGFLCGLGLGTVMPTAQLLAQVAAGREHLGAAVAMISLGRMLGAALGTAVIGAVVYTLLPDVDVKDLVRTDGEQGGPEVIRAFQVAYICAGVVAVLGVVNASRVPKINL